MKRKRIDRRGWERIIKSRFALMQVESQTFTGFACIFCIDDIKEPLWVDCMGQKLCLADTGYTWLQHFPRGKHHAISSIFDARGELVRWYIDITKDHSLDANGLLWYDDLYLDLDVSVDGELALLDVEELDEALQQGNVSPFEYELAWREADALMTAIEEGLFSFLWSFELLESHRSQLLRLAKST